MAGRELHIGVDFDNTIVRYDAVFHRLACEEKLIAPSLAVDKTTIRDHLRASAREDRWTAMQGLVYGERMPDAQPFTGVLEFFAACAAKDIRASIISHRTRQPIVGPAFDLHGAARRWLAQNRFVEFVPAAAIFFEETRAAKVERVRDQGCTHFIDDLPEFLAEHRLPPALVRILFDPAGTAKREEEMTLATSWPELRKLFDL